MKILVRMTALAAVLAFAVACQGYTLVKGGSPVEVANAMKVSPERSWSKITGGKHEVWTVDGPVLQQLHFAAELEDGDEVFPPNPNRKEKLGTYQKSMSELEVVELYRDSMIQLGATNFEIHEIGPKTVGGKQGFRFEFTFAMKEGLQKAGVGEAVIEDEKLYFVVYTGAKLHYYPKNLPDAEQVMKTVEIL